MKEKFRSFYRRLTRRVVLAVLAVMSIIAVITFITALEMMVTETKGRYLSIMRTSNEKIESVLQEYVVAMRNVRSVVENHLDSPELLEATLKRMIELNPNILGYGAAFEPDFFPQKGRWYEAYVYSRDKKHFHTLELGSASHDYLTTDWYRQGLTADGGYFVEPNSDPDVAVDSVVTYVLPIRDKSGRKIGVLGGDVSLRWLQDKMERIEQKSNQSGLLEIDSQRGRERLDPLVESGNGHGTGVGDIDALDLAREHAGAQARATAVGADAHVEHRVKDGSMQQALLAVDDAAVHARDDTLIFG